MSEIVENHRKTGRLGRKGLSTMMAAVVLGVVVVGTGAAGFVALSAMGHTSSTSQQTCSPSGSPQCAGKGHTTTEVVVPRLTLAATSRG